MTPRAFGEKIAAKIGWPALLQSAGRGGLMGAALGGVAGLAAPGEEEIYNNAGKVVGTKQRNRLAAGIRGAFWSGLGGAGLGATADYVQPNTTKAIYDLVRRTATGKPQHELNTQDNVARGKLPNRQLHQAIMDRQAVMRKNFKQLKNTPPKPVANDQAAVGELKLHPDPWELGKLMSSEDVANSENNNL
jgi:hypothetical protein